MPLITGSYKLDHFLTISSGESASRTNSSRNFTIEAGRTVELEFPAFFSEKKFSTLKKKHPSTEGKSGDLGTYKPAPRVRAF
jgi:hypothetical protein